MNDKERKREKDVKEENGRRMRVHERERERKETEIQRYYLVSSTGSRDIEIACIGKKTERETDLVLFLFCQISNKMFNLADD